EALKTISSRDMTEFGSLYVLNPGDVFGHKSKRGNLMVAKVVSDALSQDVEPAAPQATSSSGSVPVIAGNGQNLIKGYEALELQNRSSSIADIEPSREFFSETKTYLIRAVGDNGEHYVGMSIGVLTGPLTFSLEARADATSHLRLQLVGGGS